MAGTKIVTRKLTKFRGRDEEFSNTYYFGDGGAGLSPDEGTARTLINAVIDAEKTICGQSVRFLGGSAYKMGIADTPGDTDAIATVELAPTGHQGAMVESLAQYRECAVDIKLLLGGRRYLRSMIHTMVPHGYDPNGVTSTPSASLSAQLKAFAEKMLNGPWTGAYQRIAPNGDRPSVIEYNTFLEHRQFHRYKKRNAGLLS